jgi:DNA repair exonuclease SbcCD ATPase subunit
MIKLKSMCIKDFMSIKEAKIRFSHTGLYFISGYDEAGGDSNGAGKTSILSAICWAIFGRTQKGLTSTQVARWGSKNSTEVILYLGDGDHDLIVRRTLSITELSIDGTIVKGLKMDVQTQINDTLHTDYTTFVSCTMFTKGQVDFLADSGDAAKKKLFKSILGLEKLDTAYEKTKEIVQELTKSADKLDQEKRMKEETLSNFLKDMAMYREMEKSDKENKANEIANLKEKIKLLQPPEPSNFEKEIVRISTLLYKLEALDYPGQFEKVYKEKQIVIKEQLSSLARLEDYKSALKILWDLEDDARCYTCGSELTPEGKTAYAKELKSSIVEKETEQKKFQHLITEVNNKLTKIENSITTINQLDRELLTTKFKQESYEKDKDTYESYKREYEDRITSINNTEPIHVGILLDMGIRKLKMEDDILAVQKQLKTYAQEIDYYSYLSWLFSRTGVVSYIVDRSFGRLQTLTNRFLKNVARAGFSIEISPQKELKSGKVTDDITISVITNGKKVNYNNLSAGQQQRINLSLLMAVFIWSREVGANKFDFMLLDEVLDLSLAEQGQKDMVEFVGNMLKHINQIIVISHRDTIPDKSYKEIKVRRNLDGISEIGG